MNPETHNYLVWKLLVYVTWNVIFWRNREESSLTVRTCAQSAVPIRHPTFPLIVHSVCLIYTTQKSTLFYGIWENTVESRHTSNHPVQTGTYWCASNGKYLSWIQGTHCCKQTEFNAGSPNSVAETWVLRINLIAGFEVLLMKLNYRLDQGLATYGSQPDMALWQFKYGSLGI